MPYIFDLKKHIKRALAGDAEQVYFLGLRYWLGDEVVRDYKSAMALFTQAADQGFTKAQSHLALMYYEGKGIERNLQMAHYWFARAAASGDIWAQFYIALMQRNRLLDGYSQKRLPDLWLTRSIHAFKSFSQKKL